MILPKPEPKPRVRKRIARMSRPARKRRTPLAKAKDNLWSLFAAYVKERDGNVCFTCDAPDLEGKNWQAGHMIPGRGGAVLFHPELVRSQCFRCNITLGGNSAEFALRYMERFGEAKFKAHVLGARSLRQWKLSDIHELTAAIKIGGACYELLYAEKEAFWRNFEPQVGLRYCLACYHPLIQHHAATGCAVTSCDCPAIPVW